MSNEKIDYDALEARLTDPSTPVKSAGQVAVGESAEVIGHAFLMREYGSEEEIGRALRGQGRPRVGEAKGASATVRGRISDADYAAFGQLKRVTGRTQSELVREAVHQLLAQHKLVG